MHENAKFHTSKAPVWNVCVCVLCEIKILFFYNTELVLANTTQGAQPAIGKIFKCCSCRDIVVGITYCRVINVTTNIANVLFHVSKKIKIKLKCEHNNAEREVESQF